MCCVACHAAMEACVALHMRGLQQQQRSVGFDIIIIIISGGVTSARLYARGDLPLHVRVQLRVAVSRVSACKPKP